MPRCCWRELNKTTHPRVNCVLVSRAGSIVYRKMIVPAWGDDIPASDLYGASYAELPVDFGDLSEIAWRCGDTKFLRLGWHADANVYVTQVIDMATGTLVAYRNTEIATPPLQGFSFPSGVTWRGARAYGDELVVWGTQPASVARPGGGTPIATRKVWFATINAAGGLSLASYVPPIQMIAQPSVGDPDFEYAHIASVSTGVLTDAGQFVFFASVNLTAFGNTGWWFESLDFDGTRTWEDNGVDNSGEERYRTMALHHKLGTTYYIGATIEPDPVGLTGSYGTVNETTGALTTITADPDPYAASISRLIGDDTWQRSALSGGTPTTRIDVATGAVIETYETAGFNGGPLSGGSLRGAGGDGAPLVPTSGSADDFVTVSPTHRLWMATDDGFGTPNYPRLGVSYPEAGTVGGYHQFAESDRYTHGVSGANIARNEADTTDAGDESVFVSGGDQEAEHTSPITGATRRASLSKLTLSGGSIVSDWGVYNVPFWRGQGDDGLFCLNDSSGTLQNPFIHDVINV